MSTEPKNHRWAWIVIGLFAAGAVLAVLWMVAEVKRTQRQRNFMFPPATNSVRPNGN